MMIKKVDTFIGGGPRGQNPRILGVFWGSSYFSASRQPPTSPNLLKRCISVFHTIPPNFMPKFLQENLF